MSDPVKLVQKAGIGYMTLNRPEALHALNLDMCKMMYDALASWAQNPSIDMVLIDHMPGTRGFCAGGDISMLRASGLEDGQQARAFFAREYRLNAAIKAFPKPYLALMDGVTMGGGVGVSVHGSHRVATQNTVFAMPETGIGLFPDVGGGWFLPRLTGELGTWLALTGARLKGTECVAAGIATHYIPAELLTHLRRQIAEADFSSGGAALLGELLNSLSHKPPAPGYAPYLQTINRCFSADTVEDIIDTLRAEGSDWALSQIETLQTKSPETLKLALRQLREGRRAESFQAHMQMEYRIGWRKVQTADFIEGVRAVLIDKDHAPKWNPATLEAVTAAHIQRFFDPLGEDELQFDVP